ncbi:sensor kinase CusS [Citrobacter freundii]|nr:sensor kinase CusS [Citrobacter freundii]
MIHSVKVHFAEQDINDLQEISTTLERIINQPNEPESRRLETLKNVVAGYSNVIISLVDSNQKAIFSFAQCAGSSAIYRQRKAG